jgi:hypothetical protein
MPCKYPEYPSSVSRLSSESEPIDSDQNNDEDDSDCSRTAGPEDWNGFQDATLDGAVCNAEPNLESSSDSRSIRVKPSSTSKTTVQTDPALDLVT